MRRLFWVAVGAAAGVYAVHKVQQTLRAYSATGLAERAEGLGGAVRLFAGEVRANMADREAELREALGMDPVHEPPLSPAEAADLVGHPASRHPARLPTTPRSST